MLALRCSCRRPAAATVCFKHCLSTASSSGAEPTHFLSPVWPHLTTMQPVRGQGIYLYDADDNRYMDFTSGIGVTNTGHAHPNVVKAVQDQASQLIFGQMNIVMTPQFMELSRKLHDIMPTPNINSFFFANSGAEATEAAVKLVRHATQKRNIIVMQGSFHGRTAQCMAMTTSKYIYRESYQPLPSGIFTTPFPYAYQYGWDEETTIDFCIQELQRLVATQTSPEETAALFIEPVLGEGGYVPAPSRFLQEVREFCTQHDILLVVDEIQTGMGRTGEWFAMQHSAIEPDVLLMAKGMGSGMPISAVGASAEIMTKWKVGTHGGTYGGGNAVVAAAACATIDTIQSEDLCGNAARMGAYLLEKLSQIQERHSIVGDIRGLGLMVAAEFTHADGAPASDVVKAVRTKCIDNNLLILSCGTYDSVIRFIPPLVVTQHEIDVALDIFENAVRKATMF